MEPLYDMFMLCYMKIENIFIRNKSAKLIMFASKEQEHQRVECRVYVMMMNAVDDESLHIAKSRSPTR